MNPCRLGKIAARLRERSNEHFGCDGVGLGVDCSDCTAVFDARARGTLAYAQDRKKFQKVSFAGDAIA